MEMGIMIKMVEILHQVSKLHDTKSSVLAASKNSFLLIMQVKCLLMRFEDYLSLYRGSVAITSY